MKTAKIQGIISSMKDITKIALQLQYESRQNPNPSEDLKLHSRLLSQRQRDNQEFYDIFFKNTTQQRMAIINLDREILAQKRFKEPESQRYIHHERIFHF